MRHAFLNSYFSAIGILLYTLFSVTSVEAETTDKWLLAAPVDQSPWVYTENSVVKGFLYDIFKEVVSGLGHQTDIYPVPMRRVYSELVQGRAHMSFMVVHDDVLAEPRGLVVGNELIFGYSVVAVALRSKGVEVDSMDQLKAFEVGHLKVPNKMSAYIRDNLKYTSYLNTSALLKGVLSERVDVAIVAMPNYLKAGEFLGVSNELEVVYTVGHDYVYFSLSPKAFGEQVESVADKVDEVVKSLRLQGRIAEIISNYTELNNFVGYGREAQ